MNSLLVVGTEVYSSAPYRLCDIGLVLEIYLFVFDRSPEPLNEDVVEDSSFPVHADGNMAVFQRVRKALARKLLNRKKREFFMNAVQLNPWSMLLEFADTMKECRVKPELEVYDTAMINNATVFHSIDTLKAPLHFQFVLGILGGLQPTIDNVVFLKNSIPRDATWSVCAVDLSIYSVAPIAIGYVGDHYSMATALWTVTVPCAFAAGAAFLPTFALRLGRHQPAVKQVS
jgi:beta-keto acid cleavage enzyme